MLVWRSGTDAVRERWKNAAQDPGAFLARLKADAVPRAPGTAIFLTATRQEIPPLLVDYVRYMGALHRTVIALSVSFEETPRADDGERCAVELIGDGVWRVRMRFGFLEVPDLTAALKRTKGLDPSIDLDTAIYFATRDQVVPAKGAGAYHRARTRFFAFLYRNAVRVVDRFSLPPDRVVEISRQIDL